MKESFEMEVTDAGMIMSLIEEQCANATCGIASREEERVIVLMFSQKLNALSPISLTELGSVNVVSALQDLKAASPI